MLHGKETVVHSFGYGTDGADPVASLIDVNGTFYGTTAYGGVSNCDVYGKCGTVFSITPSGNESVLHRFGGAQDGGAPVAPLIEVNGTLYGTTAYGGAYSCSGGGCGTIFSVTPSGAEQVLHSFRGGTDGISPDAGLIEVDGTLYGTTFAGGAQDVGTVFEITP